MKFKSWLSLILLVSLIAINCQSLTAGPTENEEDSIEQPPLAGRTRKLILKDAQKKFSSEKKPNSKWSQQDQNDLAELDRLKQVNGSNSLVLIEGSIMSDLFDKRDLIKQRNYVVGTCTCSVSAFSACPLLVYSSSTVSTSLLTTYTTSIYTCASMTSTCDTTCTTSATSCGLTCTSYTSLTASSVTSYNAYVVSAYNAAAVFLSSFTVYGNGGSATSSSQYVYSAGSCAALAAGLICTTTSVTSYSTLTVLYIHSFMLLTILKTEIVLRGYFCFEIPFSSFCGVQHESQP